MTPQTKATKLTELWKMMDESLTREEFVTTLENFLKRLVKVEKTNDDISDLLKTTMENIKVHLRGSSEGDFDKLRSQILSEVGMLTGRLEDKSKSIDQKMALIKDGIDGKDGQAGARGSRIINVTSFKNAPTDAEKGDILIVEDTGELFIFE